MKPLHDQLTIVTATTNLARSRECRESWEATAAHRLNVYVELNGPKDKPGTPYLGTVPAFAKGVERALRNGHQIIACFHDDLLIEEEGWDLKVLHYFQRFPNIGLAGFLGGTGLGDADIYQRPYSPHQLARKDVVSNERNAEAHGRRTQLPMRVAVLDGFSQIGRAEFWGGADAPHKPWKLPEGPRGAYGAYYNLFSEMASWGITHHCYDAALGCFAARLGWEVWMLPVACWHQGGQTAVGDAGYAEWAKSIVPGGDQDFWEIAHKEVWERFRDCLPIRVGDR